MQQNYSVLLYGCRYIIHIIGILIIQAFLLHAIIDSRTEFTIKWILAATIIMLFCFQIFFYIVAKTKITIDDEGIIMEHPFRKVQARWDEVLTVKEQVALSQDSGCLVKTKKGRISFYDHLPGYEDLVKEIRRRVKHNRVGEDD